MRNLILALLLLTACNSTSNKDKGFEVFKAWLEGCYNGSRFMIEWSTRKPTSLKQQKEILGFCKEFKTRIEAGKKLKP